MLGIFLGELAHRVAIKYSKGGVICVANEVSL